MFPNNNDIMYHIARLRAQEIQEDVEASRDDPIRTHIPRRRISVAIGIGLIGLTLIAVTLALGWWVL